MPNQQKPERDRDTPLVITGMDERRNLLYNTGGWFQSVVKDKLTHFYFMAREDSDLTISMCATNVELVDKLRPALEGQRCLTCALYEAAGIGGDYQDRMERRRNHARRALEIREAREAREIARKNKS